MRKAKADTQAAAIETSVHRDQFGGEGRRVGDPDQAAAVRMVLSLGRSFKFIDDYVRPRMARMGLTMTEFSILSVLLHGGPTPLGELSDRILLTGASTTYTVKKLEERGLMKRERSTPDTRVVMGSITDGGRKLMDKVVPQHGRHLVEAMRGLTAEEKDTVAMLLRKLRDAPHPES